MADDSKDMRTSDQQHVCRNAQKTITQTDNKNERFIVLGAACAKVPEGECREAGQR